MSARNCKRLLHECLKELRLPTMRTGFAEVAEQARAESLSYEQFLLELAERERDVRGHKRIERALRASRLPLEKTLKSFDRKRLPPKVDAHINVLLEGTFLDRCENVLAFGKPGSGKTHLLCAIGQELVYQHHRVLHRPCDLLVQELLAAKRDLELHAQTTGPLRFAHHRRHRLCPAQSRGDGGPLQPAGAPLRTGQCHDHQQSGLF